MSDILLGVIVFSSVILSLVIILNVLGDILLPQGEVTLLINDDDDKSIKIDTGGTVLNALASQNVYLPSDVCSSDLGKEHALNASARLLKAAVTFFLQKKLTFQDQIKKIIGD